MDYSTTLQKSVSKKISPLENKKTRKSPLKKQLPVSEEFTNFAIHNTSESRESINLNSTFRSPDRLNSDHQYQLEPPVISSAK